MRINIMVCPSELSVSLYLSYPLSYNHIISHTLFQIIAKMCRAYIFRHKCNCEDKDTQRCGPVQAHCSPLNDTVEISLDTYCQNCLGSVFFKMRMQASEAPSQWQVDPRDLEVAEELTFRVINSLKDDTPSFTLRVSDDDLVWVEKAVKILDVSLMNQILTNPMLLNPGFEIFEVSQEVHDQCNLLSLLEHTWKNNLITQSEDKFRALAERGVECQPPLLTSIRCDDLKNDEKDCVICRETMGEPVTTPCGHLFCDSCIKAWIQRTSVNSIQLSCPICRKAFFPKDFKFPSTVPTAPIVSPRWVLSPMWELPAAPPVCPLWVRTLVQALRGD